MRNNTKQPTRATGQTPGAAPGPQADLRWLGRYIDRQRRNVALALLFGAAAGLTAAATPYLVGTIIDQIRRQIDLTQIGTAILELIGLTVISIVAFFGQRYYSGAVAFRVDYDIRHDLFESLLIQDQAFYQSYSTGDLISRMYADLMMLWRLLLITFTRLGSALLTLITAFVLLGAISLPLTIIVFLVLSLSTTIQLRVGSFLAPIFEDVNAQAGTLSALAQDAISGIQTIRTFGREAGVVDQYHAANVEYRRRSLRFERYNEPVGMLPNAISETTAAIVVVLGGVLALQGTLTVGNFVQFLLYLATISVVLLQLGTIYQRLQQARGALSRLTPLLQTPRIQEPTEPSRFTAGAATITFENVGVRVGDHWPIRGINLTIPAGKTVALVGPTGSGKTLLVSLIARLIDPTEGRVLINGTDVRHIPLADLRALVAYVPQSTFLFSQPLHENIRMGKDGITEDDIDRATHISRLSNDLPALPEGLETLVGERGVMLSGGQRQRVAIARAVIRNPMILILDDALSSVDTQTAADILADLRQVLVTRTSVIIAHRIATVKDADTIVVIEGGAIAEQGSHADLVRADGLYARMVEREMRAEDQLVIQAAPATPAQSLEEALQQ